MQRYPVIIGLLGCLGGCVAPHQGPEVDLLTVATPELQTPVPVKPTPALSPATGPGQWQAWVPARVQPNGDRIDGHWLTFDLTAPPAETMEPAQTIPRVPKVRIGEKSKEHKAKEKEREGTNKPSPYGMAPPSMHGQGQDDGMAAIMQMLQQQQSRPNIGVNVPLGGR